jgi:hypothetical protein
MPEASHVYRRNIISGKFDPGRGRTFSPSCIFYKHTNPPGLRFEMKMIEKNEQHHNRPY